MPSGSCLLPPAAVITECLTTVIIKAPHFLTLLALGAETHLGHWFDLFRQSSGLWGLMKGLVAGGCILPVPSTGGLKVLGWTQACLERELRFGSLG